MEVRTIEEADRPALRQLIAEIFHSEAVVVRGGLEYPAELPGFGAWEEGDLIGALTYELTGDECYISAIGARQRQSGIGTALMAALECLGRECGWTRIWLITTNDNLDALRFYQRRGFRLARVDAGAVERSRHLKPELPEIGSYGIPFRDEIELEKML